MKGSKYNMILGTNIMNSPPKNSFLVEFNKENECENVSPTKSNLIIDNLIPNQNTDDFYSLDKVELLDISTLNLGTSPWLLDKDEHEGNFDLTNWLEEEKVEDVGDNIPTLSPVRQPNILNSSPLKDRISSPAVVQYEALKKRAKLSSDGQKPNSQSPLLPSPFEPPKNKSTLVAAEAKNQFGPRAPRHSLDGGTTTSPDVRPPKSSVTKFLPLSLPREGIDDADLLDSHSSYLNKSFDDVLAAVTSSGDGLMQKSFSRSQENCFSPTGVPPSGSIGRPRLGQASGGSMNKLSNVEEVENVARIQADHLRQTMRSGGFPTRRLSQSTDRLRHVPNYSLAPDSDQSKILSMTSDSDDSLAKFKSHVLEAKASPEKSTMSHPRSLPSIIPQTKIIQAQSKLTLMRQDQPSKELKQISKTSSSKIISSSVNPVKALQSPSRMRNVSTSRIASNNNVAAQERQNRSFDGTPPPPVQRSLARVNTAKPVARLQPPQGRTARIEKESEKMNVSIQSEEGHSKPPSSVGSNSPSNHSSTDESVKPSSIPMPSRGIPRFSSIPRPRAKQLPK